MSEIKLVVADIDNTLRAALRGMPRINKKAIKDLHANNIMFGLASGRTVEQLADIAREWKLGFEPELIIGVNGSSMYDNLLQKKEDLLVFEKDWILEVMDFLDAHKYDYHVYIDDYTLFKREDVQYQKLFKNIERDIRVAQNREDFLQGSFFKFLLTIDPSKFDQLVSDFQPLQKRHPNDFKLLKTTKFSYEVVHARTSKALPLEHFCEEHQIDLKEVAAFGDAENDNEMIEAAGMGVCLKDGEEETKKLANYITDLRCGRGGFGDFVYKHILND